MTELSTATNEALSREAEAAGCECDPTDLRPDLLPRDGSVVAIFVENHQDPCAEDPDYDIWSYALLADGDVLVREHKNTWKVTTEACVR